jgi:pteridine reductase
MQGLYPCGRDRPPGLKIKMNKILQGKTAIVTGAARRIGRAISIALAEAGANIVVHDHQSLHGDCEKLCDEIDQFGITSRIVTADFESPDDYESLIGRALKVTGNLDILVNNASIFVGDALRDADFKNLMRHMQINAWAPLVLSREFARLVAKGKIINLLDTRINGYDWKHVSYILSKHVLYILTKMMAVEFAPGISVNAVAPGLILPPPGKDESYLQDMAQTVPLKRHGGPEDIVDAVLFLLRSDFITGQVINVDGGRHLKEHE